jgi:hypothetical protein
VNLNFIAKENMEILVDSGLYTALLDSVNISITLPFKVIENNADIVDENTGTYTWNYTKNESGKNIELIFDTSKIASKPVSNIVYIIFGVVSVILAIGIYIYYSYKKNSVL